MMSLDVKQSRRPILGPGGNTFMPPYSHTNTKITKKECVLLVTKRNDRNKSSCVVESAPNDTYSETSGCSLQGDASVESLCSAKSGLRVIKQQNILAQDPAAVKRCHWITPHSDQAYISFHDNEWGVPVHDDNRLFELLVYSQALAELSWPAILHKRDAFRKHFDDFDAAMVAQFTDTKLASLEAFLSKPKVEAVAENAKRIVKVQREFGSFNNYCWHFVKHRTIRNNIRYANQMPGKSPKALVISKDMMQRGFRCVGPTVVYSFMEAAGLVNDHLVSCFRYKECVSKNMKIHALENEEIVLDVSNKE